MPNELQLLEQRLDRLSSKLCGSMQILSGTHFPFKLGPKHTQLESQTRDLESKIEDYSTFSSLYANYLKEFEDPSALFSDDQDTVDMKKMVILQAEELGHLLQELKVIVAFEKKLSSSQISQSIATSDQERLTQLESRHFHQTHQAMALHSRVQALLQVYQQIIHAMSRKMQSLESSS